VATGGLSPGDISSPIRGVLNHQKNTQVLLGEVTDIDPNEQKVILRDGIVEYDSLIVAAGLKNAYFGNDHWEKHAPGLKSIEDAIEMRKKIFVAFEAAERETDLEKRKTWLNFVIVGGGPTGVELAGALAELAHHTLKNDFRSIDPSESNIYLLEGGERILSMYTSDLSDKAKQSLSDLGVTVLTEHMVQSIDENSVSVKTQRSGSNNTDSYCFVGCRCTSLSSRKVVSRKKPILKQTVWGVLL
jgi:NADH dehydrogenase